MSKGLSVVVELCCGIEGFTGQPPKMSNCPKGDLAAITPQIPKNNMIFEIFDLLIISS
jgi:hypothetical protein